MDSKELVPVNIPEEAREKIMQYVDGVKRQSISVLGDGEVFVRRSEDGVIKAVSGAMTLKEELGHIAMIKGKPMITADGYYDQNKIAGCTIITPKSLKLPNGNSVPNPYPIVDEKSQSISKVWVKKMCLGRNPIGNWVITSCTLLYDINMYFLQDCFKAVKDNSKAGKVVMRSMVTDDELPRFLAIQGDIGIVINLDNVDILKHIDTFINKKLNAERLAQTICERVCMRKHPAFSSKVEVVGRDKQKSAKVKVVGWINDITKKELLDISNKLEDGESVEIEGQEVIIDEEVMTDISEDDLMATSEMGESGEVSGRDIEAEVIEEDDDLVSVEEIELRQYIEKGQELIGVESFKKLLKPFKKPLDKLSIAQLATLKKLINDEINKGAML